jgi:hypothetical protein
MILAATLVAAVMPRLQGIVLTAEALGFFVAAMTLVPRLRPNLALFPWAAPAPSAPPAN